MGQSVGGQISYIERASVWRFINPPKSLAQGIIVNVEGKRYCNEGAYGAQIGYQMCAEQAGIGYLILDQRMYDDALE
jgi:3-oxo-5alpha-steroid 4-dehydrogenase